VARPQVQRSAHGVAALAWLALIPIALVFGWLESVVFVSAISLYANVVGHFSAWQAARVEAHQAEDADVQEVLDEVRELKADDA
jgi:hypothetical protein